MFKELSYFDKLHEWQVKELRWRLRSSNLILDIGESELIDPAYSEPSFMRHTLKEQFPIDNSPAWTDESLG